MHTENNDSFETFGGVSLVEHDTNRGRDEQFACKGVSDEQLSKLVAVGGLAALLAKIEQLAPVAEGLVQCQDTATATTAAGMVAIGLVGIVEAVK